MSRPRSISFDNAPSTWDADLLGDKYRQALTENQFLIQRLEIHEQCSVPPTALSNTIQEMGCDSETLTLRQDNCNMDWQLRRAQDYITQLQDYIRWFQETTGSYGYRAPNGEYVSFLSMPPRHAPSFPPCEGVNYENVDVGDATPFVSTDSDLSDQLRDALVESAHEKANNEIIQSMVDRLGKALAAGALEKVDLNHRIDVLETLNIKAETRVKSLTDKLDDMTVCNENMAGELEKLRYHEDDVVYKLREEITQLKSNTMDICGSLELAQTTAQNAVMKQYQTVTDLENRVRYANAQRDEFQQKYSGKIAECGIMSALVVRMRKDLASATASKKTYANFIFQTQRALMGLQKSIPDGALEDAIESTSDSVSRGHDKRKGLFTK